LSFFSKYCSDNKIPDFFGEKGKDSVTAMGNLIWSNNWSDTAAYENFGKVLRGQARK